MGGYCLHYYSIGKEVCSELAEKKSKFITLLFSVGSIAEAERALAECRQRYPGATHYCSAFILRQPVRVERYSDDGEPSGTAGLPMLGVLKHHELVDVLAVVIRYFGGTLLGAGGLVRIYSESVSNAVQAAGRKRFTLCQRIRLVIKYSYLGLVQSRLLTEGILIEDIHYEDRVDVRLFVPVEKADSLKEQAVSLTNGSVWIEFLQSCYIPL